MNSFAIPLDYNHLAQILGQQGKPFINALRRLGVNKVLDVKNFIKNRGFEPSIGSIFLFGEGGSYDFDDEKLGEIYIHNGTIMNIESIDPDLISYASDKYFS